jgi:hypothetical protein
MVEVVFSSKRKEQVDLTAVKFSPTGRINCNGAKGLRGLVDALSAGRICVVEERHVNGGLGGGSQCFSVFRVGERGLAPYTTKQGNGVAIDVMQTPNPAIKAPEQIVFRNDYAGYRFGISPAVNLTLGGVRHLQFWNEGTFSPAGGCVIDHPIGEYVRSIVVGQNKIRADFADVARELELRERSIPFVMPLQYLHHLWEGITFGNVTEAASCAVIDLLTDKRYLERPLTKEQDRELWNRYCSSNKGNLAPAQREARTKMRNELDKSRKLEEVRRKLIEEGAERATDAMARNILETAIQKSIERRGHFQAWRLSTDEDFGFGEVNEDYVEVKPGKYEPRPRRSFRFVHSRLTHGVAYGIPKDERSAQYLLETLKEFNDKFPDTMHIPEARENYFPASTPLLEAAAS